MPEIKDYEACHCSICHKKGYAWLFPEKREQLRFVKGSVDDLAVYVFAGGNFSHRVGPWLRSRMGCEVLGDGSPIPLTLTC